MARVLLVEDDDAIRTSLGKSLTAAGHVLLYRLKHLAGTVRRQLRCHAPESHADDVSMVQFASELVAQLHP